MTELHPDIAAVLEGRSRWAVVTADCLGVLPMLPKGSVDAVVTDPPYGIANVWKGGASGGWGRAREQTAERNKWDQSSPPSAVFDGILALGVPTIIWGGNYFPLPVSRGWLVWNKPERGFTLSEAELAWTNIDTVMRVYDCRRSDPDREHPTQKPLGLMKWCLERARITSCAVVLDPFCGSGTTGVAAMQTGRRFIGIEIDEGYAGIARRRIGEAADTLFTPAPAREEQGVLIEH